ncbi:hypothetical protein JCM33374_g1259 [Metschnikowia sp. JCM 33374]|nr:hypothetical protein JCM33374_g1259 [Metschnikowia sp. JCM 33374]
MFQLHRLLLLAFLAGQAFSFANLEEARNSKWVCADLTADQLAEPELGYLCSDIHGIVVHVDQIKVSHENIGFGPEESWVQLHFGSIEKLADVTRPLTSCVSSVIGGGAAKSLVMAESIQAGVSAGITFNFFGFNWIEAKLHIVAASQVTFDRQVEYICNAQAGERVQILSGTTAHKLSGWSFRSVIIDPQTNQVSYDEWKEVPDFVQGHESQRVLCVTDESLLKCEDY